MQFLSVGNATHRATPGVTNQSGGHCTESMPWTGQLNSMKNILRERYESNQHQGRSNLFRGKEDCTQTEQGRDGPAHKHPPR